MGALLLPSDCFTRFRNPAWPGVERQTVPLLGLGRGHSRRTQRACGTAMCLCASLSRRRRGPAGLRDPFSSVEIVACMPCAQGLSACARHGRYHYPRRAIHAVETLDARGSRRRIYRFYAVPEFALCRLNLPSAGTHATPAPNRAHSGSHAETRRVIRGDGDGVFGSGIIDPIDPFQADQTVAVALAEGHRNAVSP